jgi:predicted Fe-S protein YdhL (DUF1289 family)
MGVSSSKSVQLESSMDVASPCTGVCQTDFFDVCRGCQRTLDEISEWSFLSNSEKQQVMDRIKNAR